jgi:hypothetical protein
MLKTYTNCISYIYCNNNLCLYYSSRSTMYIRQEESFLSIMRMAVVTGGGGGVEGKACSSSFSAPAFLDNANRSLFLLSLKQAI